VSTVPEKYRRLRSFAFGDGPALADELLDLVLRGLKTATCSTEDEPNTSTPGERWIVLDGRGNPRCVIESIEVTYRRYNDVDAAFAYEEGEGDRSLAYWRSAHRRYFERQGKFSEDMMLMCDRFGLVEVFEGSNIAHPHAVSVPSPLVGEREWTEFGASTVLSIRRGQPPLPLAGEGWGGGIPASEVTMAEQKGRTWEVSSKLRSNARALRKNSTDAERILWSELRDHRLNGASFRRQVPIESYIADFLCHAARLVIELDGGQHFSDESEQADAARSAVIEAKGFKVLRFSNHDVMTNRAGVLEIIAAAIAAGAPTLTLPRERGSGQDLSAGKRSS